MGCYSVLLGMQLPSAAAESHSTHLAANTWNHVNTPVMMNSAAAAMASLL